LWLTRREGSGCNLDIGTCDSMADQREEEVPTMDICELLRHRPRCVGRVRRSDR
jgi:hypothetical protein